MTRPHIKHAILGSFLCGLLTLVSVAALAQIPGKAPTLTMAPVPLTTAQRATQTMVDLIFRVPVGYHINSNTPKSEFLIPTALKTQRIQRRLHHLRGRASAEIRRSRKIRDARSAPLPGLRQLGLLSPEKSSCKFRSESGEGTPSAPCQSRAEPTRAQLARSRTEHSGQEAPQVTSTSHLDLSIIEW